jgi:hypothetical protein
MFGKSVLDLVVVERLHPGARQSTADGAEQIIRQGKLAALRGAELEGAQGEIARARVHIGGGRPLAVAQQAVAEAAAANIDLVALGHQFVGDFRHRFLRCVGSSSGTGWPGRQHPCQGDAGGQAQSALQEPVEISVQHFPAPFSAIPVYAAFFPPCRIPP